MYAVRYSYIMLSKGRNHFVVFMRVMLALLIMTSAGRSEAGCFQVASDIAAHSQTVIQSQNASQGQAMENCAGVEATAVHLQHQSPYHQSLDHRSLDHQSPDHQLPAHHSDGKQAGMCHAGCLVLLPAGYIQNNRAELVTPIYMPAHTPPIAGLPSTPVPPPPRFD